jgi:hypothetical protein
LLSHESIALFGSDDPADRFSMACEANPLTAAGVVEHV